MRRLSKRATARTLIGLALVFALVVALANIGLAVHDNGLFELDGNTLVNAHNPPDDECGPPDDWAALYNDSLSGTDPDCTSQDFVFTNDKTGKGGDDTYFTGGGSKDREDVSKWQYTTGDQSPDKNDIVNAFAAAYRDGDDHLIAYFGADRFANNGDAQMGFWFFKTTVETGPNGTFVNENGDPAHHTDGDTLVLVNFNQGGELGLAGVYVWAGGVNGAPVQQVAAGARDCQTATGPDDFCSTTNKVALTGDPVWPYTSKTGSSSYPKVSLIEGGVDLTALGAGECFPSYLAETRSSSGPQTGLSLDAQLKDFSLDQFELCAPSTKLTKTADKTTIHSGDSVTYTYTDENDGRDPLTNVSVTDDKCSPVTQVKGSDSDNLPSDSTHNIGDADNDNVLDPGETWTFTCSTTLTSTTTNTATASGFDAALGKTVTFCAGGVSTATCFHDPDERAQATVTVIAPATSLRKTAAVSATYTYKEKNTGNDPLSNVSVTDDKCSPVDPTLKADNVHNIGDADDDGLLDPGETWTFTCTMSLTSDGQNLSAAAGTNTGTGHGTDSLGTAVPVSGEQDSVTVTVTHNPPND
jgi:hypothetical protein